MGVCVGLWVWHHVCGGLNLQHIQLCKLHFRRGETVSKHFETTFEWITRSLWCGGLKAWRASVGPLHCTQRKHHVTTCLSIGWRLEGVVLFSIAVLQLIQQPGCAPSALSAWVFLLDNQLVFSASPGYVRGVNICWEHLSNVDRTGVWRHFSRSDSQGCGCWPCLQCAAVKGLFLPVLSNVSHDFMITVGQCAGRDFDWLNVVQVKIIITIPIIIEKLKKNNQWVIENLIIQRNRFMPLYP